MVAAAQGSYSLTGQAAITIKDTSFTASQGGYALTGQPANFLWDHVILALQGAYTLTGQNAILLVPGVDVGPPKHEGFRRNVGRMLR